MTFFQGHSRWVAAFVVGCSAAGCSSPAGDGSDAGTPALEHGGAAGAGGAGTAAAGTSGGTTANGTAGRGGAAGAKAGEGGKGGSSGETASAGGAGGKGGSGSAGKANGGGGAAHAGEGGTSGSGGVGVAGAGAGGVSSSAGAAGVGGVAGAGGDPAGAGGEGGAGSPGGGDLEAAHAFLAPLVLGANVERGWSWSAPGDVANSPTYWAYLKNTVGLTHVRLFYPWRPTVDMGGGGPNNSPPDQGRFNRILDGASQAMSVGLKVFLDCTDVMGPEDFQGSAGPETEAHLANCASWVAARNFDPTLIAVGPVNEWAGGNSNADFNDLRQHYHDVLRAKLPGYVLTTGPGYWKSRDWLYDDSKGFKTFDDLRVIYEWHGYSSLDGPGWQAEEAKLAAWRAANGGRPTACGEAGPGWPDENVDGTTLGNDPGAWPARFGAMLPMVAPERPSLWAITYGGSLRLNKSSDDPAIMDGSNGQPNLLQTFLDGEAAIKAALPPGP